MAPERMSVPLAYQGVERLQVLCLLQTSQGLASPADRARLCESIAQMAGTGTQLPVSVIETGDPQVVAPNHLTLLVHGALDGDGTLALTIRPYRPSVAGSDVLFGARPRMANFNDASEVEAAISASLDEILPWRATGSGVRPL